MYSLWKTVWSFLKGKTKKTKKKPQNLQKEFSCDPAILGIYLNKTIIWGVPIMAQWKRIWLVSMRTQVWSLASLSRLRIQWCHELSCGVGRRRGSDLALLWLWLWRRPTATAIIHPLAWEPPYATGVALNKEKKKEKRKKRKNKVLLYSTGNYI